jgi:Flp pilus assembly protein TadG
MFRRTKTVVKENRYGIVAVLVAVTISLLLGIAAIALDGGLLQDNKRRVQNATDAAALAAANTLFTNSASISSITPDPGSRAAAAARQSASDNGFPNNATNTTVVVNIPPKSGPFANQLKYVEVIITYQQPRYFSTVWGSTTLPVAARAVARGYWGGTGDGVIVLDPTAKDSLDSSGTGSVTVTGGAAMIVDSNSYEAARQTGGGSLTAPNFEVTGGTTGTFTGHVDTGVLPTPDPLAYLPVPPVPPDGTMTTTSLGTGNHQYVLTPGRYHNLPSFQSGDVVILKQASYDSNGGIYYIDGGGLVSTGATIIMDPLTTGGVMIYNNPASSASSQGISIQGNAAGVVNLSALSSGPYAGLLMWQNRTSTVPMSLAGNGSFNLTGTFYAANANLQITGNGIATIGSQYISRTLNLSGNGIITINYTDNGTARKRDIRLVE